MRGRLFFIAAEHATSLEQFRLTREYIAERLGDVMDHYGFER